MLFGMVEKLDKSKKIKEIITASLSYLNFPPKYLTRVILAKACFSLPFRVMKSAFCPLSQELLSLFSCTNITSL